MIEEIKDGESLKEILGGKDTVEWGNCGSTACPCGDGTGIEGWLRMATAYMDWFNSDPI